MSPQRIQLKRTKGWKMPPNTVKVTRPGEFGNPFQIKTWTEEGYPFIVENGSHVWRCESKARAQEVAVIGFRNWLSSPQRRLLLDRAVLALRGKNLACFCKPGEPCHADVLLELANAPEARSALNKEPT